VATDANAMPVARTSHLTSLPRFENVEGLMSSWQMNRGTDFMEQLL
jgi:hypothetical protein